MSWTSPYFTEEEMKCRYSGISKMDAGFMDSLTKLRELYDKPMIITSAYRDPSLHPIESMKEKRGAHTYGRAVDIAVQGADALKLLQIVMSTDLGFTRVGIAQKGAGRFIHLDNMTEAEGFPRTIWSY